MTSQLSQVVSEEQRAQILGLPNTKKQADALLKVLKPVSRSDEECKRVYQEIKRLRRELNMVFEWHDGILVEAMTAGGLLLVDEISLANDSVLERLNSVFEQDRMLILSEKSSSEAIKIVAQDGFNIVATMNPSGDFGKKELSPALRNRMTEIWVESYFMQRELLELYPKGHSLTIQPLIHREVSHDVDLFLIILKMSEDKLRALSEADARTAGLTLFNMIGFVNFTLAGKYSALQRKALSVRDVINAVEFVEVALPLFKDREVYQLGMVLYHAVSLVITDGICLGIDVAGDR